MSSRRYGVAIALMVVIAILLSVIAWPTETEAEVQTDEVIVTYHPQVNSVCFTGKNTICVQWWVLLEPGSDMNRDEAYASIYGDMN